MEKNVVKTSKRIKHLELLSIGGEENEYKGNILVIGNAYGIMPYQEPLAQEIEKVGYKPYWFAFRGQEGVPGYYSFETGVEDIKTAVDYLQVHSGDLPLDVIGHCSGSLLTLEYLVKNPENPIKKLIIYGLLYSMNRRRKIAEKKFELSKVKYKLSEEDWNYKPLEALSKVDIPIFFCHARDESNLGRGAEEEMQAALSAAQNAKIQWFDGGYDNNLDMIPHYVRYYREFLGSTR